MNKLLSDTLYSRAARALSWAVGVSLVYFLYWFIRDSSEELFLNPVHFFDDAYMFIRYARIWHLGYGESWNIGEGPVYGNTSQLHFLFVLLLTSFSQLSNEMVIKLSSYLPSLALMIWLPWFCARHALFLADRPVYQRVLFWTATVCPFLYWATPFAYHFLTGMDTALSALLHLLLIDLVLTTGKHVASPVSLKRFAMLIVLILFLAFETRPESILPCGLFVLLYFSLVLEKSRQAMAMLAATAILLLADALFKYHYFGDIVPLAFYSKKSDYLQGFAAYVANHPLLGVSHFLVIIWPLLAIVLLSGNRKNLRLIVSFVMPVLLVMLYFLTMMSIMNIRLRYEYPFVIYMIALAILVFPGFAKIDRHLLKSKLLVSLVVLLGLVVFRDESAQIVRFFMKENPVCNLGMINSPLQFNRDKYTGNDGLRQMSDFLHELPPGTKVAMTEHGFVGANNLQINIIDVIGLHSHFIAHNGFSADWLFAQQPDAIWVPHWNYTCLDYKIFSRPEFWDHYELYPLLFNWGIALRKDSPRYDVMVQALRREMHTLYPELDIDSLKQTAPNPSH
jgi:hypothetical protein